MKVFKAPEKYPTDGVKVFLAGSIEQGKAEDWQTELTNRLKDANVTILNPRRDNWNCVDLDTKAITNNGIKSVNELSDDDLILTYNTESNVLEYTKIEMINTYEVIDETLLEFTRNSDTFYFTNNHKILSRKTSKNDQIGFYDAESFINKIDPARFPCGKTLINEDTQYNTLLGQSFLPEHFMLYAWLLSEGSIFKRNDCDTYDIVIAQYIKNSIKVDKIKTILDKLNIEYRYNERQFKLSQDAVQFIFGFLGFEKYKIPDWIKHATVDNKLTFINEYALGDGSIIDGKIAYIAFSKKYELFAQQFQILCYEAGITTKWREKTSGFGFPVINIQLNNPNKKWYSMKYTSSRKYTGTIWCPSTKNKTWVAYKNGTPFITGNSSWEESIHNKQFAEQVNWELDSQEIADLIVMYFSPETKSPITLLELGLFKNKPMVVCCPDGFWRKGNVEIVCDRFQIPLINDKEEFMRRVTALVMGLTEK